MRTHPRLSNRPLVTGILSALLFLALMATPPARGTDTPSHPGTPPRAVAAKPVLSITTPAGIRQYTLAELEAVGLTKVTTKTFWPADDGSYQGPLLADVLKLAGLDNTAAIRVSARDGFSQVIPRSDWTRWPLLLATRRDSHPLSARDKGPLRIIYPRDQDPALEDTIYRLRWVWLVRAIEPAELR